MSAAFSALFGRRSTSGDADASGLLCFNLLPVESETLPPGRVGDTRLMLVEYWRRTKRAEAAAAEASQAEAAVAAVPESVMPVAVSGAAVSEPPVSDVIGLPVVTPPAPAEVAPVIADISQSVLEPVLMDSAPADTPATGILAAEVSDPAPPRPTAWSRLRRSLSAVGLKTAESSEGGGTPARPLGLSIEGPTPADELLLLVNAAAAEATETQAAPLIGEPGPADQSGQINDEHLFVLTPVTASVVEALTDESDVDGLERDNQAGISPNRPAPPTDLPLLAPFASDHAWNHAVSTWFEAEPPGAGVTAVPAASRNVSSRSPIPALEAFLRRAEARRRQLESQSVA